MLRDVYFVGTGINTALAAGRYITGREQSVYEGEV